MSGQLTKTSRLLTKRVESKKVTMKALLFRKINGFTLIEMMIAVAILGITLALAIPSYDRYLARGRQGEAKNSLISAYVQEYSFKTDTGSFTGCLKKIGYDPTTILPQRYYTTGFSSFSGYVTGGCGPLNDSLNCLAYSFSLSGGAQEVCAEGSAQTYFVNNVAAKKGATLPTAISGVALPTKGTLRIEAQGVVGKTGAIDKWSIDHNKNAVNYGSGL